MSTRETLCIARRLYGGRVVAQRQELQLRGGGWSRHSIAFTGAPKASGVSLDGGVSSLSLADQYVACRRFSYRARHIVVSRNVTSRPLSSYQY